MSRKNLSLADAKETIASLQMTHESMKMMNKELVLNLQRMKKEVADSAAQICSLKAELYDMIVEKNSLMEKNTKLAQLLRSSQAESSSVRKMVDDLLIPRESERSRLSPKQSAVICPMVSGHIIHNPKVELRRLNFCELPNVVYTQENDGCLSPVIEEPVQSRLSHRRIQMPQNVSNMMNREVEENFFPVGAWTVEDRNNLEDSETIDFTPASSENNLSPSSSNETLLPPGSSQNDVKPSGSRFLADENTDPTGKNSVSLTTINVMSPNNDPQSSGILLSPSVFVNVCTSKRRYAAKTSPNNGYTLTEVKEESNDESQDSNYTNIIKSKYPIVVFERLPDLSNETVIASVPNGNGNTIKGKKLKRSKDGKTKSTKRTKVSVRSSSSVEGSRRETRADSLGKRRSCRNKKNVSYKE